MLPHQPLLLVLAAVLPAGAANLIVNGSFETPLVGSSSALANFPTITGWTPVVESAVYLVSGNAGVGYWPYGGQDGDQYADFGNEPGTGIQQTVTIPIGFGVPILTWYDATLDIASGNPQISTYTVSLIDAADQTVASSGFGTDSSTWTQRSLSLPSELAPGQYTLSFIAQTGISQKDTLLDNVSLIPEPSAALLLSLAVPALFRRRRVQAL